MTDPIFCQIRVKGHLSQQWTDWFSGLKIEPQPNGETVLSGALPDQTALYTVLNRMRDLNLALVFLNCEELKPGGFSPAAPDKSRQNNY